MEVFANLEPGALKMSSATLSRPTTKAVRATTNLIGGLPLSVSWRLDDNANVAEIQIPKKRFHEFRQYNAGKSVWIKTRKNFRNFLIFQGYITGRSFSFSSDSETVTIICMGPRWRLGADFLKGRYILNSDGDYRELSGLKCIFNEVLENSQVSPQNGAISKEESTGIRPFSLNPRSSVGSKAYNINEMLWYTYSSRIWKAPLENVVGNPLKLNQFGIGSLGTLEAYDIDVDGLSLDKAINTIFKKGGLRWWCRPISTTQSEIKAFLAGPAGDTPRRYLYLADIESGVLPTNSVTPASIGRSKNNVEAGQMQEDFADVANEVFGFGARKIYQKEWTLIPGWDSTTWADLLLGKTTVIVGEEEVTTTVGLDIALIRKQLRESTSDNWELYKDIGRKWILDEAGTIGDAYDFEPVFEKDEWTKIVRPFIGDLIDGTDFTYPTAKNPESNVHEKIETHVRILKNQAGIYIEGDELSPPLFTEQNSADLGSLIGTVIIPNPQLSEELKITACVKEDKALEESTTEIDAQGRKKWLVGFWPNSDGSQSEVNRRMPLVLDTEYQTDNTNTDKETEVAGTLYNIVTRKKEENQDPSVSASFSIPWVCTVYKPGDIIIGIRGRDLKFTAQIVEVRFEFEESQKTELVLEDLRLAEY